MCVTTPRRRASSRCNAALHCLIPDIHSNAVLLEIHFGADVPHDWRGIIWKNARHRRQVADIAVHDAEEGGDRALIGGNRIEVTRQQFRSCGLLRRAHPYSRCQSPHRRSTVRGLPGFGSEACGPFPTSSASMPSRRARGGRAKSASV